MKLDGAVICALIAATERCGGVVNLGRLSGVDPSCLSRYLRGRVSSVSDGNWGKLKGFLHIAGGDLPEEEPLPVIEWRAFQKDPGVVSERGGPEKLILRAQGLQMAPQICDKDLIVVRRQENLTELPENKIVVAVFNSLDKVKLKAVCKRVRKINGIYWFFSDEPHGRFFPAGDEEILWAGVVLRKICEL
jgi:hypothetical protein